VSNLTYDIAVLPGDGIGPEVIHESLRVLRAVESKVSGLEFNCIEYSVGAGEYLHSGSPLSTDTLLSLRENDAILLGAMGLPDVRWPDGLEMTPQIDIREQLDLYCGLRPIHLYHRDHTPLRGYQQGEIDFVIVRENTEGLFSGRHKRFAKDSKEAWDTLRVSRSGSERLFRVAFQQATRRRGRLTLVDKANVLPSMIYFRQIFDEISSEFPEVKTEKVYVDAASLYLLQRPHTFDVIVTENMFGDILSDLAAGLVGGMGMAPSADVGDEFGVFQPCHGSAPDIAGRGVANPTAAILSVAMMLDWLAHPSTILGASYIRKAVEVVLQEPNWWTRDIGGILSTQAMGDRIVERLDKL
jgi:3-isopropylmalate dehydrogenase